MIKENKYKSYEQKPMSNEARELRNAASREWRAKNREKVKEYNRRYWERKAARAREKENAESAE